MEQQLHRLNPWWSATYTTSAISREIYLQDIEHSLSDERILFLVGMRRIGKTTLIKCVIERLQKNTDPRRILFAPLDHPELAKRDIRDIVEKFREIHKIPFSEKIYIFLDEIQAKKDFETELKALADNENVKIICSGSQSLFLRDKKAQLTGRTKTIRIEPLSFNEFLMFSGIRIQKGDEHLYKKYFEEYLEIGGIPNYVLNRDPDYLVELLDAIITKDIVAYHNLKNPALIKELFLLLCERIGKRLSINKIAKILSANVESIRQYISYMEDTFLIHVVYRHAKTLNERIKSNRKIYIADVGLRNVMTGFRDTGAVFENLVFLTIKDQSPQYYYEDGKEVDFVFDDTAIECKYREDAAQIDKPSIKSSNKIVSDYSFFLPD